jgi:hypothetical protein
MITLHGTDKSLVVACQLEMFRKYGHKSKGKSYDFNF